MAARTLFEKIWDAHVIEQADDGQSLLFIDRHLMHDGSFQPFARLHEKGLPLAYPELSLGTPDHYVPTNGRSITLVQDQQAIRILDEFDANMRSHAVPHFRMGDGREGIVHIVGPEQGFTLPGTILVCGDSHTATHGALGALAFGIGASEVAHVMATQALWQLRPKSMQILIGGRLAAGVSAKDLALALIASIGTAGAVGHAVEYAGSAIEALSIEERCTLCNMSIEAGAKAGFIAPDATTFAYLKGRPLAPAGDLWEQALQDWQQLPGDPGCRFDRVVPFDGAAVTPMVTWGTSPEQAVPIAGHIPDPASFDDPVRRSTFMDALHYMDLSAGQAMAGLAMDRVFIGSCTNARIEDLRLAAAVMRSAKGRVKVPTLVSAGSGLVKRMAEAEGLAKTFVDAGAQWGEPGCSMCVGMNGDLVGPGQRCASTSNRNFVGRQGRNARTHLVSPATAAATAMLGRLADAREFA